MEKSFTFATASNVLAGHQKNSYTTSSRTRNCIQRIGWTPKKFLYYFLKNEHTAVATRRGYWGSATGWTSTKQLLDSIRQLTQKTVAGKALWKAYILKEAQICVNAELSTRGASNKGNYYSLATIDDNFFDKDAKAKQEEKLNKTDMPFLYTLIYNKLQDGRKINEDQDDSHSDHSDDSEEEFHFNPAESPTVECSRDQIVKARQEKQMKRSQVIAKTMVSMIAFGQNQ
ncbi:hypothetical protein PCASD_21405 [Puccinia coronata f. sp. avenae]|uniref:Uncharacterized protein n=1 Tax=Puccinia coronata f. sp. avenae TaxID=200324 RepID=A0A2N5TYJ9_9BASI|nr:hypothetical protein PCASD_21405 [Puccinia coronata f. sp. avenae]